MRDEHFHYYAWIVAWLERDDCVLSQNAKEMEPIQLQNTWHCVESGSSCFPPTSFFKRSVLLERCHRSEKLTAPLCWKTTCATPLRRHARRACRYKSKNPSHTYAHTHPSVSCVNVRFGIKPETRLTPCADHLRDCKITSVQISIFLPPPFPAHSPLSPHHPLIPVASFPFCHYTTQKEKNIYIFLWITKSSHSLAIQKSSVGDSPCDSSTRIR